MATHTRKDAKKNHTIVERRSLPLALFAICIALLLVAVAASLMLALEHFGANLPGCGPESDCAQIARSYWGEVPIVNWPTSFLGVSYFLGILIALVLSRKGPGAALRWILRAGGLASIGFLFIMIDEGHVCEYCVAVHAANLLFLLLIEIMRGIRSDSNKPLLALAGVFIASSLVLWPIDAAHRAAIARDQEQALQQMIGDLANSNGEEQPPEPVTDEPETRAPFTGRYLRGPAEAAIRIVALTDFACPDCLKIEKQIDQVLRQRSDVSLSIKQFPMSNVCNPYVPNDMHPKACYAARVAEAAGILGGNSGFWAMHDWLFDNIETFNAQTLPGLVRSMGYDWAEFSAVMNGAEVQDLILADIEEGRALGLHYTPMIFLNGHELSVSKGLFAPNAVIRAVNAVAATNPPPRTAEYDQPPLAPEKYIQDWRDQPQRRIPPAAREWARGDQDRPLQIVVWGDYQESGTCELDGRIRAAIADRDDVNYVFRHYPMNDQCNPVVSRSLHPLACKAALAAEAAGILGGEPAWRGMHRWLMANPDSMTDDALRSAAKTLGLDPDDLMKTMGTTEASDAVSRDARTGKNLGLRAIPFLFVDGRWVPRWRLAGQDILERIILYAANDLRQTG